VVPHRVTHLAHERTEATVYFRSHPPGTMPRGFAFKKFAHAEDLSDSIDREFRHGRAAIGMNDNESFRAKLSERLPDRHWADLELHHQLIDHKTHFRG